MAQEMMPSEVRQGNGKTFFDRFADAVSRFTSKAWFFALCVLIVVIWGPSFFLFGSVDTWQLIINTLTTIVTFLLMALLQNTQARSDAAIHQKLNAIAEALADLQDDHDKVAASELRQAVGLEEAETTS
jgi:low affinity Fe/Cu permease